MSRDGSGTYTFPSGSFNPAVSGATPTSSDWNSLKSDIETAMSASIAKDGQTTCTARIPFAQGIAVGGSGNSAWQVGIKGQGTTSATYGIVHRDSASADVFWTRDDGVGYLSGRFGISDTAPNPAWRLSVLGSGTSSATYGVVHRNSATTDIFYSRDDGVVFAKVLAIGASGSGHALEVSTDDALKPSTNTWTISSDARIKTVLGPYEKGLDALCGLKPIRYRYNGLGGFTDHGENISVIAQEAREYFPECVGSYRGRLRPGDIEATDILNWNGHALAFAMINAFKEVKARLEKAEKRIAELVTA